MTRVVTFMTIASSMHVYYAMKGKGTQCRLNCMVENVSSVRFNPHEPPLEYTTDDGRRNTPIFGLLRVNFEVFAS